MSKRILVINVARFGDTLLLTPVLRAIKAQMSPVQLTVLAHPKRIEVLQHLPFIDELAPITKHAAFWRARFGSPTYDVAIVYGQDEALVRYALRVAKRVIAFEPKQGAWPTSVQSIARPKVLMDAVQERALLSEAIGVSIEDFRLSFQISEKEHEWAKNWLVQHDLQGKRLIGLQLQSFPSKPYRDWPAEHFYALAQKLLSQDDKICLLLLGDQLGQARAQSLQQQLSTYGASRVHVVAGTVTMRENAAIMKQMALYIGVDTGPTHLAGALGVPMVALYHSVHPGKYLAPRQHPNLIVIEHPNPHVDVSANMADISVEQVWQSAVTLLNKQI